MLNCVFTKKSKSDIFFLQLSNMDQHMNITDNTVAKATMKSKKTVIEMKFLISQHVNYLN